MFLNTIQASEGARKKSRRLGRGIGSTVGKTCGKGHKGQKARAGGFHKVGFEGGQMPLQRRLPKIGFLSRSGKFSAEVRLSELEAVGLDSVDFSVLTENNIVPAFTKKIKIINSGEIKRAVIVKAGIFVTKGAKLAIEKAGGKIEV